MPRHCNDCIVRFEVLTSNWTINKPPKRKGKNRLSHNISQESEDRATPIMIRYIEDTLSPSPVGYTLAPEIHIHGIEIA